MKSKFKNHASTSFNRFTIPTRVENELITRVQHKTQQKEKKTARMELDYAPHNSQNDQHHRWRGELAQNNDSK